MTGMHGWVGRSIWAFFRRGETKFNLLFTPKEAHTLPYLGWDGDHIYNPQLLQLGPASSRTNGYGHPRKSGRREHECELDVWGDWLFSFSKVTARTPQQSCWQTYPNCRWRIKKRTKQPLEGKPEPVSWKCWHQDHWQMFSRGQHGCPWSASGRPDRQEPVPPINGVLGSSSCVQENF